MPIELCSRGDCVKPSECVVVITVTNFVEDAVGYDPLQLALCREHAETILYLARRSATR